jgi:hypothetical protein
MIPARFSGVALLALPLTRGAGYAEVGGCWCARSLVCAIVVAMRFAGAETHPTEFGRVILPQD